MNEPTKEQIEEFWEWCGFKYETEYPYSLKWVYPDGGRHYKTPPTDLNNLFKYAVLKLMEYPDYRLLSYQHIGFSRDVRLYRHTWGIHFEDDKKNAYSSGDEPALALFWALWQVSPSKKGKGAD